MKKNQKKSTKKPKNTSEPTDDTFIDIELEDSAEYKKYTKKHERRVIELKRIADGESWTRPPVKEYD